MARRRVRRYIICAHTRRSARKLRTYLKRYRAIVRFRRTVTPFPGPNGTWWAVPYRVVWCESHGSWSAHNSSSPARGAYQLLGHGEPWPANTRWARRQHHLIAHGLYASSGLGPWEASRSCWG